MESASHFVLVFVILLVGFGGILGCRRTIPAHDRPYYMKEVCQRDNPYRITFNTAARVQPYNPKNIPIDKSMNCAVILDATVGRKVQVTVRDMNSTLDESMNRSKNCLVFMKDEERLGRTIRTTNGVCSRDVHETKIWLHSDNGMMTVKFTSDDSSNLWFDIVATSYTDITGNETCNDFLCANRKCVIDALKCDQVDHCGDGSDEWNRTCSTQPNKQSNRWSTFSILFGFGLGFASASLFGLCLCLIKRCCCGTNRKVAANAKYGHPQKPVPVARGPPPDYFFPQMQTDGHTYITAQVEPLAYRKTPPC